MSEVEALAQALYAKDKEPGSSDWLLWEEHSPRVHAIWHRYAERFLSSDWLAAHDAKVRAEGAAEVVERVEAWCARTDAYLGREHPFVRDLRTALAGSAQSPAPGRSEVHRNDYFDGDGFVSCQECYEALDGYVLTINCAHRPAPTEGSES